MGLDGGRDWPGGIAELGGLAGRVRLLAQWDGWQGGQAVLGGLARGS